MLDRERIIVLKKSVYRDSDLIIRGINSQGAKVSYLAPAALKSRKRFGGGVLEPTNFIEVVYQSSSKSSLRGSASSSGDGAPLQRLQEAHIIKEFSGLRRNYEILQTSLSILSLVDRLAREGETHSTELFNVLGFALQTLSRLEESSLLTFRLHFLLRLLFQQGILAREAWMEPFLMTSLHEHYKLKAEFPGFSSLDSDFIMDQLPRMERLMQNYVETGQGF